MKGAVASEVAGGTKGNVYPLYVNKHFGRRPEIQISGHGVTVTSGAFKRKSQFFLLDRYAVARVESYDSRLWSWAASITSLMLVVLIAYRVMMRDASSFAKMADITAAEVTAIKRPLMELIVILFMFLVVAMGFRQCYRLELIDHNGETKVLASHGVSHEKYKAAAAAMNAKLRQKAHVNNSAARKTLQ